MPIDKNADNIQVMVRIRPFNPRELAEEAKSCLILDSTNTNTIVLDSKPEPKQFNFDWVGGDETTQENIFEVVGKPMIEACLEGYNCCIFAYGQTGAGKTFTMQGRGLGNEELDTNNRGLQPRVFDYICTLLAQEKKRDQEFQYLISCSYLELYNEQIKDLLEPSASTMQVREDLKKGVYIEGLKEQIVTTAEEAIGLLQEGIINRHVAATNMNMESSRSHSVFTMNISTKNCVNGVNRVKMSKFHFVDLAGSERQKQTSATGERLKEASNINKSLLVLGQVINSLVETSEGKTRHIRYRDSKLTFLLKDSIGGNAKTCLIANISPAPSAFQETLSTLKFAQRAKMIKNRASINEDASGSVTVLKKEIKRLRDELMQAQYTIGLLDNNQTRMANESLINQVPEDLRSEIQNIYHDLNHNSLQLEALLKHELENTVQNELLLQVEIAKKEDYVNAFKSAIDFYEANELQYRSIINLYESRMSEWKRVSQDLAEKEKDLNPILMEENERLLKEKNNLLEIVKNTPTVMRVFMENIEMRDKIETLEGDSNPTSSSSVTRHFEENMALLRETIAKIDEDIKLKKTLGQRMEKMQRENISASMMMEIEPNLTEMRMGFTEQIDKLNFEVLDLKQKNTESMRMVEGDKKKIEEMTKEYEALENVKNRNEERYEKKMKEMLASFEEIQNNKINISEFEREIKQIQLRNLELKELAQSYKEKYEDVLNVCQEMEEWVKTTLQEKTIIEKQFNEQLDRANMEKGVMMNTITSLENNMNVLLGDLEKSKEQVSYLSSRLESFMNCENEHKMVVEELQVNNAHLQQRVTEMEAGHASEIFRLETMMEKDRMRFESSESERVKIQEELDTLTATLNYNLEELQEKRKMLNELHCQIACQSSMNMELEMKVKDHEELVNMLKRQLCEQNNDNSPINMLSQQNCMLKDTNAQLEMQIRERENLIVTLQTQIQEQTNEDSPLNMLTKENYSLKGTNGELEIQIKEREQFIMTLQNQIVDQNNENSPFNRALRENHVLKNLNEELQMQIREREEFVAALQGQIAEQNSENSPFNVALRENSTLKKNNEELENEIGDHKEIIEALRQQIDDLTGENSIVSKENNELKNSNAELAEQIKMREDMIMSLQSQLAEQNSENSPWNIALRENGTLKICNQELEQQIKEHKTVIMALENQIAEQNRMIADEAHPSNVAVKENILLKQAIEALEAQIKLHETRVEELQKEIIDQNSENSQMSANLEETSLLKKNYEELSAQIKLREARIEELQNEIINRNFENSQINASLKETSLLKKNYEELSAQIKEREARIEELQKEIADQNNENSQLNAALEENCLLKKNYEELGAQIKEREQVIISLQNQVIDLTSEKTSFNSVLKENRAIKTEMDLLKMDLSSLQATLEAKEAEIKKEREKMTELNHEIGYFSQTCHELAEKFGERDSRIKSLQDTIDLKNKEADELRKTLIKANDEIYKHKQELEEASQKLKKFQNFIFGFENQLQRMQKEKEDVQALLDAKSKETIGLNQQINDLQNRIRGFEDRMKEAEEVFSGELTRAKENLQDFVEVCATKTKEMNWLQANLKELEDKAERMEKEKEEIESSYIMYKEEIMIQMNSLKSALISKEGEITIYCSKLSEYLKKFSELEHTCLENERKYKKELEEMIIQEQEYQKMIDERTIEVATFAKKEQEYKEQIMVLTKQLKTSIKKHIHQSRHHQHKNGADNNSDDSDQDAKVEFFEEENSAPMNDMAAVVEENIRLKNQFKKQNRLILELNMEAAQHFRAQEEELEKIKDAYAKLESQYDFITTTVAIKEGEAIKHKDEMKLLLTEQEKIKEQIKEAKKQEAKLERVNEENKQTIKKLNDERLSLILKVDALNRNENNLAANIDQKTRDKTNKLRDEINHLKEEKTKLMERLNNSLDKNDKLQKKIDELARKFHSDGMEMSSHIEEVSKLQNELAKSKEETKNLSDVVIQVNNFLSSYFPGMQKKTSSLSVQDIHMASGKMQEVIAALGEKERELRRRENDIQEKTLHYNIIERELAVTKQKYQLTHSTAYNAVNADAQKENHNNHNNHNSHQNHQNHQPNHENHDSSMVIVKKLEEQTKGSDVDPTIQIKKTRSILDDSLDFVNQNQFMANNKKQKRRLKKAPFEINNNDAIVIIDDSPNVSIRMDESVQYQGTRKKVKVDR